MRREAVKLDAFFSQCDRRAASQRLPARVSQHQANIDAVPEAGDQLAQASRNKLNAANDARPKMSRPILGKQRAAE